ASRLSSTATLPVVRISSATDVRSTLPVLTPILCKRCGDICTGTNGASVDAGGVAIESAVESFAAEFAILVSETAIGFTARYCSHNPTRTTPSTTYAINPAQNPPR